jgi:hypothetical protein
LKGVVSCDEETGFKNLEMRKKIEIDFKQGKGKLK